MKLKILQWNVWYKEDPKKIAEEIIRFDPDIVCAQELMQNSFQDIDTAKTIAEITKFNCFYKESETWDNRPDKSSQGNAIFSKHPFKTKTHHYVTDPMHNPPDASSEGRVYIEASFQLDDKTITVGTSHMSYSNKFEVDNRRKIEADKLIKILSSKKENFIFCTDLNATPDSYTVKGIVGLKDIINLGPEFNEPSWTTKPFDYKGFKEDKLVWRLDYVFGTKDIKVIKSEFQKTDFSDHLPILIGVEI